MTEFRPHRSISLADYLLTLPADFPARLEAHGRRFPQGETAGLLAQLRKQRRMPIPDWPLIENLEETAEEWIRKEAGNATPHSVVISCPECGHGQEVYNLLWTNLPCPTCACNIKPWEVLS